MKRGKGSRPVAMSATSCDEEPRAGASGGCR